METVFCKYDTHANACMALAYSRLCHFREAPPTAALGHAYNTQCSNATKSTVISKLKFAPAVGSTCQILPIVCCYFVCFSTGFCMSHTFSPACLHTRTESLLRMLCTWQVHSAQVVDTALE